MSTAPNETLIIGKRYRVIRELAVGGMGAVYEAENLRTRRRVAIKTIRPEVASRASVIHRFELEAQAAGQLQHPNIVEVLDLGDDAEHQMLFSVQEFLVGGDLGRCLEAAGRLDPRAALATLLPVLDAVSFAHQRGVVHRDIKPDNIFLHETLQGVVPKLIDFGVAKLTDAAAERRSAGSLVGSPIYMSPEQARADGSIDGRTDIWSMGVVFYEALTGRTPFEGPSAYALLTQIAMGQPIPLAELAPELPADLVAVIQRAVTSEREDRWQTAAEFAEALRATATWRAVDPTSASTWIPSVTGAPLPRTVSPSGASERTTAREDDPGPEISADHRSGLWTGEVPSVPHHPAPVNARSVGMIALAMGVALGAGMAISSIRGPSHDARPSVQVLRPHPAPPAELPAAAATPTVAAQVAVAEPVPVLAPEPEPAAPEVAPDAGRATVTHVARSTRRRVIRRPVHRTPTATEPAAPVITRGFNGSPIVD